MKINKKARKRILVLALVVIAIIIVIIAVANSSKNKPEENIENETNTVEEDKTNAINFYEDFNTSGTIKNLKNAMWNGARFTQMDNKLQVAINVMNQSKDEKVAATKLTVKLFDKDKKEILTKDVQMPELAISDELTVLNLEFEIEEFVLIYDIQIIANK